LQTPLISDEAIQILERVNSKLATATKEEKRSMYKTALELVAWYPKTLREEKEINELAWGLYAYSFYVLWKLRDSK